MNLPSLTIPTGLSSSTVKLTLTPLSKDLKKRYDPIPVLFNPNSYSITKTVSWRSSGDSSASKGSSNTAGQPAQRALDAPTLEFGGGQSRQLTLNLFYDVTEQPGKDVREETGKVVDLTKIDRDEQCPLPVEISWGSSNQPYDFPFVGVITNLTQAFTLFSSQGIPLRANLTATVTEYPDPEKNLRETDPELTTRIVKLGDTLSGISGELYGDPGMWRVIADANGIENPQALKTGVRLTIPKVE